MISTKNSTLGILLFGLCMPWAAARSVCGDAVVVAPGDTLGEIADRCHSSVGAIMNANPQIEHVNLIRAGTTLRIPAEDVAAVTGTNQAITTLSSSGGDDARPTNSLAAHQIDDLVAPIALYPDVLLTELLAASTYPLEIVQAARWRKNHPDLANVEAQDWAPSVKALLRYPEVLNKMNDDLDWTARLGDAFLAQQEDVFDGIQRLRAKADALGNLQTTEQQIVVKEPATTVVSRTEVIRILPADPHWVYVPAYDPHVVYVTRHSYRPWVTFGVALALGAWIVYDLDWHHHHIYHRRYDYHPIRHPIRSGIRWRHNPHHRRHYRYPARVAHRYRRPNGPHARGGGRLRNVPSTRFRGRGRDRDVRHRQSEPRARQRLQQRRPGRAQPRTPNAFQGYRRSDGAHDHSRRGQRSRNGTRPRINRPGGTHRPGNVRPAPTQRSNTARGHRRDALDNSRPARRPRATNRPGGAHRPGNVRPAPTQRSNRARGRRRDALDNSRPAQRPRATNRRGGTHRPGNVRPAPRPHSNGAPRRRGNALGNYGSGGRTRGASRQGRASRGRAGGSHPRELR